MRSVLYIFGIFLALGLSSCKPSRQRTNWTVTLSRADKNPYGGYIAHEAMRHFFPKAKLTDLSSKFRYSSLDYEMGNTDKNVSLLVAVGLDFYISDGELEKLLAFAEEGNEIVLFARSIDSRLSELLQCKMKGSGYEELPLIGKNDGKKNLQALSLIEKNEKFGYQGRSVLASFLEVEPTTDSTETEETEEESDEEAEEIVPIIGPDTLGFANENPNFIRYAIGEGHLSLHAAPLALSNYFLLQKNNKDYLSGIWKTLPSNITRIYWNDYYKRNTKASDLSILLQYPATRWAFVVAVFALLAYLLFESKRRQRIIAEIKPLENSSVSFVETVGKLYFNKGNHQNLAEKMIQHFFEWVRTHYFISTSPIDDQFARLLQQKSGMPEQKVNRLIELIHEVNLAQNGIDEQQLHQLHNLIEEFYKNHKQ